MQNSIKRIFNKLTDPLRISIHNGYIKDDDDKAQSRRNILFENIYFNIIATLTGGVFLTGLILYILEGESEAVRNNYLGTVISVQVLANFFQILTPIFTAKMKSYRPLMLTTRSIYFSLNIVGLAIVPILPIAATTKAVIFTVMIFIIQLSTSFMSPAVCAWHITDIPVDKRADWMSVQQMILPITNIVSSLLASFVIDKFELKGMYFASVLLVRGILMVLVFFELRTNFKIKEPPEGYTQGEKLSLKRIVTEPFKCKPFLVTVLIVCLWQGTAFPGQYYNAYILNNANVTYTFINLCGATNIPLMLLFMPLWNKIVHKKGWLWTLSVSTCLYIIPHILNMFVFQDTHYFYLISYMTTNIVSPGFNLCFSNLVYTKMPSNANRTAYIAFYSAAAGLVAFLMSYAGKLFIKYTEGIVFTIGERTLGNTQYIMFAPIVFILLTSLTTALLVINDKRKEKLNDY